MKRKTGEDIDGLAGARAHGRADDIVMVAIVTFVATWLALGFDPGFLRQWAKAFVVAWPIAADHGFLRDAAARRWRSALSELRIIDTRPQSSDFATLSASSVALHMMKNQSLSGARTGPVKK